MGVGAEDDLAGFGIAHLRHQLVADAVGAVDVGEVLFSGEGVAQLEMADVLDGGRRDHVVVDEADFIGVPDLLKPHLLKLFGDKGDEDVVDHHPVDVYGDDLAGGNGIRPGVSHNNLFNQCMSHRLPSLDQAVPLLHRFDKPPGLENIEEVLRQRADGVGLPGRLDLLTGGDGDHVPFRHMVVEVGLDQ